MLTLRPRRAFLLFALFTFACGSRSSLLTFGAGLDEGGAAAGPGSGGQGGKAFGGQNSAGKAPAGGRSSSGGMLSAGASNDAGEANGAGEPNGAGAPNGAGQPNAGEGGNGGEGGERPLPHAVEVAAGAFTSCARFDDASLRCWGTGGYIGSGSKRTIGDDEPANELGPVVLGGPVAQVSASWWHTCAVLESGKVRCFGDAYNGMLGYANPNDIGDDETPASAGDVNVGGEVLSVAAGPEHTCAVLQNGKLRCWGKNDHFQLGSSDATVIVGDDELPASAGFVDVGGKVVQVACGWMHTCALLDTGHVRCWGHDLGGNLGYADTRDVGDDETPAEAGDVDVGGTVTQITAGMHHTCALLDTGKVRCWGSAQDGRLGYGNYENIGDDETPASAGDVDIGGEVTQISADAYFTCALLKTGSVRCWGQGREYGLGYANTEDIGDDETPASAGDIDLGGKATAISVGFLHACAVLESGKVRCWGRAQPGSLGYGNIEDIGDDETPGSAGDVPTP